MMCSMTMASRPFTTPAARVHTAPHVPAGMVPNATSMSLLVTRAGGAGAPRAACSGGVVSDRALDVLVGPPPIERTAHLFDLRPEAVRHEIDRRLPCHFDESWCLEHRFEVKRPTEAHAVHHH